MVSGGLNTAAFSVACASAGSAALLSIFHVSADLCQSSMQCTVFSSPCLHACMHDVPALSCTQIGKHLQHYNEPVLQVRSLLCADR